MKGDVAGAIIDIGNRLELFVDDLLIEQARGATARLHEPVAREVAIVHDEPWEGSGSGYHAVFKDGDLYRMYYKGWDIGLGEGKLAPPHRTFGCYAESRDGLRWVKPRLDLWEYSGSKGNNIVWGTDGGHDFTAFLDTNPSCPPEARYKTLALGEKDHVLLAFQSADGLHWEPMGNKPAMTGAKFDSQNVAFWDGVRGEYRAYVRDYRQVAGKGVRGIQTTTSSDFVHWGDRRWLEYPGAPVEQLYTNQVQPYYRAPHIFMGFPARYIERQWGQSMEALPGLEHRRRRSACSKRYGSAVTDGLFMASRDSVTFKRWNEVFLRPGLKSSDNWAYGDNYIAWGMFETPSAVTGGTKELSLFATEAYWVGQGSRLRRYAMRIDGFVSMHATLDGGEFLTPPLRFQGGKLTLNLSTSGAGAVRVEIQNGQGQPIDSFALEQCDEVFGDDLERVVSWQGSSDVSRLAGKPLRLRFSLKDADLYSLRFQ